MNTRPTICALCFASFESTTSYGLCPNCWQRDKLREFDRLENALHGARRQRHPASLTLPDWLAILSDFNAYCAFCLVEPFDRLEVMTESKGVVTGNVVPICRSCYVHRHDGWEAAMRRVTAYLNGESGDLTAKRFPVFDESEVE